ncbi:Imm1 family immunity protein [Krasilnikovia sp. MM14-A1259]|uniref:Imm1 family immunity protein n=1 Tax=Krasilnikovia sp. MM14-A1259 TaxID=3373539 RepID=UPI00399CE840
MPYRIRWPGTPETTLSSVDELDVLLDRVAADRGDRGLACDVEVSRLGENGEPLGVVLGVGHPERSFVHFTSETGMVFGYEVDVGVSGPRIAFEEVAGSVVYHPPALTRVRPAIARQAAREFVTTGWRPTGLQWLALTWRAWVSDDGMDAGEGIQY